MRYSSRGFIFINDDTIIAVNRVAAIISIDEMNSEIILDDGKAITVDSSANKIYKRITSASDDKLVMINIRSNNSYYYINPEYIEEINKVIKSNGHEVVINLKVNTASLYKSLTLINADMNHIIKGLRSAVSENRGA